MSPRQDDDADGPPTPQVSGYLSFASEALRVARFLDQMVLVSRKRIDLYDEDRIRAGEDLSGELKEMAAAFKRWPSLGAMEVSYQRAEMLPALKKALDASWALLKKMPTVGVLGEIPRTRK